MRKHFDAINQQRINAESLVRILRWRDEHFETDPTQKMLWSFASGSSSSNITFGYICGADPVLLYAAEDTVALWAQASLDREEWRPYTRLLNEKELRQQYYLDVGKVFEKSFEARPEAWLHAHAALFYMRWLRDGIVDYKAVQTSFDKIIEGVKVGCNGVGTTACMAVSAWSPILEWHLAIEASGKKYPRDANLSIAVMLAKDPSQLHDPRSPVRKKARNYIRHNMSQNWLADIGASDAARWLRTFEWREGQSGLSPREVMLRAYAYMPEVEAPDNIAAEVASLRKIPI